MYFINGGFTGRIPEAMEVARKSLNFAVVTDGEIMAGYRRKMCYQWNNGCHAGNSKWWKIWGNLAPEILQKQKIPDKFGFFLRTILVFNQNTYITVTKIMGIPGYLMIYVVLIGFNGIQRDNHWLYYWHDRKLNLIKKNGDRIGRYW